MSDHRRLDPIRRRGDLDPAVRRKLHRTSDRLRRELDRTDRLLAQLGARRHRLAGQLAQNRDRLWPKDRDRYGRRPGPDGAVVLGPLPTRPTKLWGRRLRAACLAILGATGESSLPELHAHLHHRGYEVDSAHPVKALADALGYETDQGRARRIARGVYEACC
jgi:hypothetical protein